MVPGWIRSQQSPTEKMEKCICCGTGASSSSPSQRQCGECSTMIKQSEEMQLEANFSVEFSPEVGRYLIAKSDYQPGQLVLFETAQAVGPNPVSTLQCITCGRKIIDNSFKKCSNCGYIFCEFCDEHLITNECKVLKGLNGNQDFFNDEQGTGGQLPNHVYEPILPMRLLLDKWNNPKAFDFLLTLMDHEQDRKNDNNGQYWSHSCDTVIEPLVKAFQDADFATDFAQVAKVVGITEVNNCEIFNSDGLTGFRGLFPKTSLMSHSCVPNCRIVQHQEVPYRSYATALRPIVAGEELTISYVNLLMPTHMRRKTLRENWYFDCICKRCQDPTELNSFVGSIKCTDCCDSLSCYGTISDPLNLESVWKFDKCQREMESAKVLKLIETLLEERNSIAKNDVANYRGFLAEKCNKLLHPNHYITVLTKRWLLPLLHPEDLQKMDFLQDFLKVIKLLNLGLCKDKGRAYFELVNISLYKAKKEVQNGVLTEKEFKKTLKESILPLLQEVNEMLKYDPKSSYEGKLADTAMSYSKYFTEYTSNF